MIPLQTPFREKHPVTHAAFSPDGGTVAVAQPHAGVTLLERATGRVVATCPTPRRGAPTGLTFTGDGRLLVVATAKGVSVFDARTGACPAVSTNGHNNGLMLGATGDGAIGVRGDCRTRAWTSDALADGGFNLQWPGGPSPGRALAVCPAGRLALVAQRTGTALFDLARGRLCGAVERPEPPRTGPAPLPAASFCPLGRRFAVNDGRALDVYDAGSAEEEEETDGECPTPLVQRAGASGAVAVAPRPRAVLSPVFTLHPDRPAAGDWRPPFALLPDGRGVLVKRPRNRVQRWDAPAAAVVAAWGWGLEWVTCLAAAPDGLTAVAGGRFGRVLLWDLD